MTSSMLEDNESLITSPIESISSEQTFIDIVTDRNWQLPELDGNAPARLG